METMYHFTLVVFMLVHVVAEDQDGDAFPWAVRIEKNGNFHCGGTLLNARKVATVANCVRQSNLDEYRVFVGFLNGDVKSSTIEDVVQDRSSTVQVLTLSENVIRDSEYVSRVPMIARDAKDEKVKTRTCYLAGWNKDSDAPGIQRVYYDEDRCEGKNGKFCFDYGRRIDTCIARRGSAVVCFMNRRWHLVGQLEEEDCNEKYSNAIQLSQYRKWISNKLKKRATTCSHDQVLCNDKKTCATTCNNITECSGAEDELNCAPNCATDQVICNNKIDCATVCNNITECSEGEDEINCEKECVYGSPDWCLIYGIAGISGVTSAEKILATGYNSNVTDCLNACSGIERCGSVGFDFVLNDCLLFGTTNHLEVWPTDWSRPPAVMTYQNCGMKFYVKSGCN